MGILFVLCAFLLSATFGYSFNDQIGKKVHPIMQQSSSLMIIGFLAVFVTWYFGITLAITYDACERGMEFLQVLQLFFHVLMYGDIWAEFTTGYSALETITLSLLTVCTTYWVTMSGYVWFANIMDKEILNTYITHAEYYEWWREEYYVTEFYTVTVNGKTETRTRTVRKERDNSPYWIATTELGDVEYISEEQFEEYYCKRFGNRKFVAISRSGRISGSDTGNKYVATWDENLATIVAAAVVRMYVNYIQGAPQTLLKYSGDYSNYEALLPEYPLVQNSNFGTIDVDRVVEIDVTLPQGWADTVDTALSNWLALNASAKQVNILVVITHQLEEFAYALHQRWDGGNKNDVVVVLGVDQALQLQWGQVLSWSNEHLFREKMLQRLRQVADIGTNPNSVAQIIIDEVNKGFVRRTMESLQRLTSRMRLPGYGIFLIVLIIMLINFFPISYYSTADMGDEIVAIFQTIGQFFAELIRNFNNNN